MMCVRMSFLIAFTARHTKVTKIFSALIARFAVKFLESLYRHRGLLGEDKVRDREAQGNGVAADPDGQGLIKWQDFNDFGPGARHDLVIDQKFQDILIVLGKFMDAPDCDALTGV